MKPWYLRKTAWIGGLTLAISIASFVQGHELIADNPQIIAWIGMAIGIATIVCRQFTEATMMKEVEKARRT